ncbi:6-bladed beta-propeller [Bacteroides helcogenes]|uniref:6-bladed beta-propeller n=1 Tax=Bacteroides helcogenes (strain ATCC 35417 / DSM 20613 / JCM 6297 / CCUG 15421 / P 36-108) TaxID=693979 RepID=E6SUJ1_BACT6|nr:6-bladed beta-propeller [Bacteroides helcogenes]ADV43355.1 hypothetical protein Bache_1349 [Bacteroides helcogenes P 36-108]MDY5238123.1 6-bladed beta-propeller [Bacteroides helcogenes]
MKSLFLLLIFCTFWACRPVSEEKDSFKEIEKIVINPQVIDNQLDLSEILSDSLDVIALETRDECLISEIDHLEYYKDMIFVSDRVNKKILVFTSNGRYLKSIGKQGAAPGEYVSLGDFSFKGDSVVVQDRYKKNYIIYDLYSTSYREVPYNVFHWEMISFGDCMSLVSNNIESSYGNYNLFEFNLNTAKILGKKLPFKEKDTEKSTFGLKRYASKCDDEAMLIYPLNDTIYTVKKDEIFPSYVISFTERNLPEKLNVDKNQLYRYVHENKFLKGWEYMQNSRKYLLGYYIDDGFKYFIFNKQNLKVNVGKWLVIGFLGNMSFYNFCTTSDNTLYTFLNADILLSNWISIRKNCKNDYYRDKMDRVAEGLNDDSNPVLFRWHFKDVTE